MNKTLAVIALGILCAIPGGAASSSSSKPIEVVDEYTFKMSLKVPRTYDNMQSLGYRKYQTQMVQGTMRIVYSGDGTGSGTYIEIDGLYNKTHKVSGKNVTYKTLINESMWFTRIGYIGSNKTGKFTTPFVSFAIDANPSYNIGADEPDNSLILVLSGYGSSKTMTWQGYKNVRYIKKLSGSAAGDLGCGCSAYGHKSATRTAAWDGPTCEVTDVATVRCGSWAATWKRRYTRTATPKKTS